MSTIRHDDPRGLPIPATVRAKYPEYARYFTGTDDIARVNARNGNHFFSPDTMRFFFSRIGPNVYGRAGRVFVTSEQYDHDSPRLYTVRAADGWGMIHHVSDFQAFATRAEAVRFAEKVARIGSSQYRGES